MKERKIEKGKKNYNNNNNKNKKKKKWKGCVVRIEDRALPICFVQDKRTVSHLFIKRLWLRPCEQPGISSNQAHTTGRAFSTGAIVHFWGSHGHFVNMEIF